MHFLKNPGTLLDVRSPKEYSQGHIPNATHFPLFTDNERHEVGLAYKHQGKQAAIELGSRFVGPKLPEFLKNVQALEQPLKFYCARGGMRSHSVSAFFSATGIQTLTLAGGYKAYRGENAALFSHPWNLIVLTGMTGVGKTEKLHELKRQGEQIIDLEELANHRGSAFGNLGPQPTTEQFQNNLADELSKLDPTKPIYIEDESQVIGSCHIPTPFFITLRRSPLLLIEKSLEERLQIIAKAYAHLPRQKLIASVKKIEKRLGGVRYKEVIHCIETGHLKKAALLVMHYYDKAYQMTMRRRGK